MTTEQLVIYLRSNVNIQNADVEDSVYLSMSDDDIKLYLLMALTRNYPDIPSLDKLPNEYSYPIMLLAKKELYYALAIKEAPLYDLGADNNNYLKRSQRFEHYMSLLQQADKEYADYLEDGGAGGNTLTSFNVLLPNRYPTRYNYEKGASPALSLYIDNVGADYVEISWSVKLKQFKSYKVLISSEAVYDPYLGENPLDYTKADKTYIISDVHVNKFRVTGLETDKQYYITVVVEEMSGLKGYAAETVTISSTDEEETESGDENA